MPAKKNAPSGGGNGLTPSPIDAWDTPDFEATTTLPLSSGRVVVVRPLNLTAELLAGTLPDQVLEWEIYKDLSKYESTTTDADGKPKADPFAFQKRTRLLYESKILTLRRGLVTPKLVSGPPDNILKVTPEKHKGEIAPWQLRPAEIDDIYNFLMWGVLPDKASAPFPAGGAIDSESERDAPPEPSGEHAPEPDSAPGDGQ